MSNVADPYRPLVAVLAVVKMNACVLTAPALSFIPHWQSEISEAGGLNDSWPLRIRYPVG